MCRIDRCGRASPHCGPARAPGVLSVQWLIDVSTKGRIFVRGTRTGGSSSDRNDVAPGDYRYEAGRIIDITN